MKDLKTRALRGGVAKGGAQVANFLLRMGSLIVLARLLDPADFGLVGMVTAITGFLSLFREFGLSVATIQRPEISDEQTSTLFWINMLVGVALCLISIGIAPLVASFYREPRLSFIMALLSLGFVFTAAGVQHSALLQRQLRFTALAITDVISLVVSTALTVILALNGYGYWSLVAWSVAQPLAATLQLWVYSKWIPGRPHRNVGAGSLVRFGGIVTLNMLVVHVAYNLDKVLLGRFWGAGVVGIYGRAYQLITLPTDQVNGAIGSIAMSALSRLQHEPERLRNYFCKGYSLVLAVTTPIPIICAVFANDIILVMFGPKWTDAIPVFRWLAPAVLVFAIINPTGWLLVALGRIERSLKIAMVIAPVAIAGCVIGLPYGGQGVAIGFSVAMVLWVVPHLLWSFSGTGVSFRDIIVLIRRPLIAATVGALCAFSARSMIGTALPTLLALVLGCAVFAVVYLGVLLFVMRQNALYLDIIRSLRA